MRPLAGLFLSLLLLLSAAASAEVARLRSGEHGSFTRLVIESPALREWRFGRAEDGYIFEAGGAVTGFDLSQVFAKIGRARIADVTFSAESPYLFLHLGCACHAKAFEIRQGAVVIDVAAGAAPKRSPFEAMLVPRLPERSRQSVTGLGGEQPAPDIAAGGSGQLGAEAGGRAYDWVRSKGLARPSTGAARYSLRYGSPQRRVLAEAALDPLFLSLRQYLVKGAAEGVVELRDSLAPVARHGPEIGDHGVAVSNPATLGISAETARGPSPNLTLTGAPCLAPPVLDLAAWGREGAAAQQMGSFRSGLLGEFDQPNLSEVAASVRYHLGMGFGAEARQLLRLMPEDSPQRGLYLALSYLVDLESDPSGVLSTQSGCDTSAALWAALGLALESPFDLAAAHGVNTEAVARHFSELSPALRAHLAPKLVDLSLAIGEKGLAQRLSHAARRQPHPLPAALSLTDARLALSAGETERAGKIGKDLLRGTGEDAVAAASIMVEAALAGGRVLPAGSADRIAALQPEARLQGRDAELRRAEALAAAMEGDFARAFADEAPLPQTLRDLWDLGAETMPEDIFLAEAAKAAAAPPPKLRDGTALAIARRLMQAGFPAEAIPWLSALTATKQSEAVLLAAEAHLALRQTPQALAVLHGVTSPAADLLRARIYLRLGDPASAAVLYARAGAVEETQRASLLAGDYNSVATIGTAPWRDVAALALPKADLGEGGPLTRATALGEEAIHFRQSLEMLLSSTVATLAP